MANKEFDIQIKVRATSDDAALQLVQKQLGDVSAKIKETAKESEKGAGSVGQLAGGFKNLLGSLGVVVGLTAIIAKIKEGGAEAIAEARAFKALTIEIRQWDKSVLDAEGTVEEFSDRMKELGRDDGETIQSLRELIPLTHSLENAMAVVALAQKIHIATGKDYQAVVQVLSGLVANNPRSLKTAYLELGVSGKDCQDVLDKLHGQFKDYGTKIKDQQLEVERLRMKWDDFWKAIGGFFSEATLRLFGAVAGAVEAVNRALGNATPSTSAHTEAVKQNIQWLKESLAYQTEMRDKQIKGSDAWYEYQGYIDNTTKKLEEYQKELKATEQTQKSVEKAFDTSPQATGHMPGKEKGSGDETIPPAPDIDNSLKGNLKTMENYYLTVNGMAARSAEIRRELDQNLAEHIEETSKLLQEDITKMDSKELRAYLQKLRKEEQYFKAHKKTMEGLNEGLSTTETTLQKKTNMEKGQEMLKYAEMSAQIAMTAFGRNKALNIVATIISTASAAMAALDPAHGGTPLPAGAPMLALTLAMGAAQIAAIMSAKPSASAAGGWDIPTNIDPVVQAHGGEMILTRELSDGFRRLLEVGFGATTTSNNYGGNRTYNIKSPMGIHGRKQMIREIRSAERFHDNGKVR